MPQSQTNKQKTKKKKHKQQDIVTNSTKTLEIVHIKKKIWKENDLIFFSEFHITESQHRKVFLTWAWNCLFSNPANLYSDGILSLPAFCSPKIWGLKGMSGRWNLQGMMQYQNLTRKTRRSTFLGVECRWGVAWHASLLGSFFLYFSHRVSHSVEKIISYQT